MHEAKLPKAISIIYTENDLESVIFNCLNRALKFAPAELKKLQIRPGNNSRVPVRTKRAAEILGMTEGAIRVKAWKRELPCIKKGKYLYFFEDELIAWLNTGARHSTTRIGEEVAIYDTQSEVKNS